MKPHEGELREGAGGPFGGHTLFNTATPGGQVCPSGGKKRRRVSVPVSLSGRVACFPVVVVVCCGALLPCVVFCGAVLWFGAVLSCSAVCWLCCLCLHFLLLCPVVLCSLVGPCCCCVLFFAACVSPLLETPCKKKNPQLRTHSTTQGVYTREIKSQPA